MDELHKDGSVLIKKDDLSSTLICKICNDFYKSPHIITSCYCTYCYGCLDERMKNGLRNCPSCGINFDLYASGQTLPDQNLQAIIDHIRPYFMRKSSDCRTQTRYEQKHVVST